MVTDENGHPLGIITERNMLTAMRTGLNLNVIAEGVETEEQLEILQSIGCRHFQGYLFGKPVPIEKFNASLKQG